MHVGAAESVCLRLLDLKRSGRGRWDILIHSFHFNLLWIYKSGATFLVWQSYVAIKLSVKEK